MPSVLIQGETGNGKGLLARAMHAAGPRAGGPFIDVNCAAIPETLLEAEMFGVERGAFTDARQAKPGLFQLAHRGTIFLDEIGLLPEALQAKLLKAIEEHTVRRLGGTRSEPVDVWVIAATNEDLAAAISTRRFRADLYHRLAVVTLSMPPLRDRGDDLLRLAEHFLARACADYGLPPKTLTPAARSALVAYAWPGNVRELSNVVERVALMCEERHVSPDALALPTLTPPPRVELPAPVTGKPSSLEAAVSDVEREHLIAALEVTGWNITQAALRLGISRNTMRYRIEKHGLHRDGAAAVRAVPDRPPAAGAVPASAAPASAVPAVRERRRLTLLRAAFLAPAAADVSSSHRLLETISDKIRSFGGHLEDVSAGGVVAAFGLTPVEDAPVRAAHAAAAIVNGVERARQAGGPAVAAKVVIHVTDVLVEQNGTPHIVGSALAAEVAPVLAGLLERGEPGAVVVSESAATLLERRFDVVRLGGEGPRGFRLASRERREPGPGGRMTKFVGRQHELELLRSRLETAVWGSGQLVGISGDAGIGKSRLLYEFRHAVLGETAKYLEAHCVSYGSAVPYLPVLDLLRAACGISDSDRPDAVAEKILATVAELDLAPGDAAPYLLRLLGIRDGAESIAALDAEVVKARTAEVMRQMSVRASRGRPLVILVEDLHWVDRASEEYLTSLSETVAGASILLVATYRSGYRPPWIHRSYATQVALQPLHADHSRSVVRAVLGDAGGPEGVIEQILAKGEGNPFFLEELARAVREQGAATPVVMAPDTIKDVLLARIGRLGPEERRVLQAAAVIGKDVALPVLATVTDVAEPALGQALQHLRAGEFLYETAAGPEAEYTFKHALTQEVAYGSLPDDRRRRLHAAIVTAIEKVYSDRLGDHVDRLAHHAFEGGVWPHAVLYLRDAGHRAASRSAYREATARYEQALVALGHLPQGRATMEQGVDLRFDLRNSLHPVGDFARLLDHLHEARDLAQVLGDDHRLGRVSGYMVQYFRLVGDSARAVESGRQAIAIADRLQDFSVRVAVETNLGPAYTNRGEYRTAIEILTRAVESLPHDLTGEPFGLAGLPSVFCRIYLVAALAELGEFDAGIAHGEEAGRLAQAADHLYSLTFADYGLGSLFLLRGDLDRALPLLERGFERYQSVNFLLMFPLVASSLGSAYALSGRHADAIRLLEQAVQQAASMARMGGHSMLVTRLGEAYARAGRLDEAGDFAERARRYAHEHAERGHEAYALRLAGDVAARRGVASAETNYEQALARAEELGMRPLAAHCHRGLAALLERAGPAGDAERHAAAAATLVREMGMRV